MKVILPLVLGAKVVKKVDNISSDGNSEYQSATDPKGSIQVRIGSYFGDQIVLRHGRNHGADDSTNHFVGIDIKIPLIVLNLPHRVGLAIVIECVELILACRVHVAVLIFE